jgi:hypothetical protein
MWLSDFDYVTFMFSFSPVHEETVQNNCHVSLSERNSSRNVESFSVKFDVGKFH